MTQKDVTTILQTKVPKNTVMPLNDIQAIVEEELKKQNHNLDRVSSNKNYPYWKTLVQRSLFQLKKKKDAVHFKEIKHYLIKDLQF